MRLHPFLPLAALALTAASPGPLIVKPGETWAFAIDHGQPVRAHRVAPDASPPPGQLVVAVRALMGTTMTIRANSPVGYTYKAELLGGAKRQARACAVPANNLPAFESWPGVASPVRLSDFKQASAGARCP